MLKRVRMSERTDYLYEVIFDWDNDRHWCAAFNKGDTVEQICHTLRQIEAGIRNDALLNDQHGEEIQPPDDESQVMRFE